VVLLFYAADVLFRQPCNGVFRYGYAVYFLLDFFFRTTGIWYYGKAASENGSCSFELIFMPAPETGLIQIEEGKRNIEKIISF
jgi:hypothetical protein